MISLYGMTLKQFAERCNKTAQDKGFAPNPPQPDTVDVAQKLLLIVEEITEAHNELRSGHAPWKVYFGGLKPEGFPIELADAVIRIADLCEQLEIDLQSACELKMNYNETRPYLHGRKF